MKFGIATVSISGNLEEKIEAIAAAGFDGIEIFEQDFIADARPPREVGTRIRDAGLDVMLFQPFRDFEGLPGALRQKAFDRAERKFDLMEELGCDLTLVCSSVHPEALGGVDRAAADLAELGERAAARGLRVGYEALAWGRHVDDHRDAWEIVRRADHPNVGLILDSFHTIARGIDPETIRRIPGDRIFFVQLADAPRIDMDLIYWSRHFRNMPGEGDLDVPAFMQAVMATGYAGPVSLEIFNDQFRGGLASAIARDGHRSLVHLMDQVRRKSPDLAIDLPRFPAPAAPSDVAFLEFAAKGGDRESLANLLDSLGFARVGRHVSKDLDLWQQGGIRIVVNSETSGHASRVFNVSGTNICDIGLKVSDATATIARAEALGVEPVDHPRTEEELAIPAIRGLGGSVLHFLDDELQTVWNIEFRKTGVAATNVGLTRIDHVAQTMNYDEMLSWSLFYTTLFGMQKNPMVDVIDPDGIVRSQALSTGDGAVRITLNGAETHRTLAGEFLSTRLGATVQHIALATDDIFQTAAALAERGFSAMPVNENYYVDLASRFDLDDQRLADLKAHNIFYDCDDDAEFFQLYSKPFAGAMFFEIVERRGGYKGYGAQNAPFRIAAQKRLGQPKGMPRY